MILDDQSSCYTQPDDIHIQLKKHQLAMLQKAVEIESKHSMCIMRDKPGSGKTYVVLSLIHELKKKKKKVNVIIVPHNIYFQWIYSIDRLCDGLSYSKFVEYDHLLNLYNHPEDLYEKDIILVSSSFYNVLAGTMSSLKLNVDRLFIDEIDNVSSLINQSFNADFIMFISASFSIKNDNGFFTQKLKETNEEDISVLCDESFVDRQLNLEEPIHTLFLCNNIYVDKVLDGILDKDEIKNINACYYKVNNKHYDQKIATNEKNLIALILKENTNLIDNFGIQLGDVDKNISFYVEKKEKKNEYFTLFNTNIQHISKIFALKKKILHFIEDYMQHFDSYIHPKLEFEYRDMLDLLVEKRRTNCKEFRIYLNNLLDSIYHFYQLQLDGVEVNEENIKRLQKVYVLLNNIVKNKPEEVKRLMEDFEKMDLNEECNTLYTQLKDTEETIICFTEILENINIILRCDQTIENLEKNKEEIEEFKVFYNHKKELLLAKLKENQMCPICYTLLEDKKVYVSGCCSQKICGKCVGDWVDKYKKTSCIYCNSEGKELKDYVLFDQENKIVNIENEVDEKYTRYAYSKMDFLEETIRSCKHKEQRLLIFSDFSNIFNNIIQMCKNYEIEYEDLEKGNLNDIEKAVMNYKYGNAKILLANSTLFSCGMNLENSTHVLFIHRIEDKIIHQVLGRAQRLGRTCQLEVIHLEYENEMKVDVKKTKDEITIEEFETKATEIQFIKNIPELPSYEEVKDVNLDELISSLH